MIYSKLFPRMKANLIIGYTTRKHLLLDIDNISQNKAYYLAKYVQKTYPKTGDCLIVRTRKGKAEVRLIHLPNRATRQKYLRDNHHLIFDNSIGYNSSCKIIEVLADMNILGRDYVKIRKFRGDMTLRVSPSYLLSEYKPIPKPLYYITSHYTKRHDGFIYNYLHILLATRELYKDLYQEAFQREVPLDDLPSINPYTSLTPQSPAIATANKVLL